MPGWLKSGLAAVVRGAQGLLQDVAVEAVHRLIRNGRELLNQGSVAEATDVLTSAVTALELITRQESQDARRRLHAQALSLIGQAAEAAGDPIRARKSFADSISAYADLHELNAEEWGDLATALHGSGELERAIDTQRRAARSADASPEAGIRLARWLRESGEQHAAEAQLRRLVARFPDDLTAGVALADTLLDTDVPDKTSIVADVVSKLIRDGRLAEAQALLDRAVDQAPSDPLLTAMRATVLAGLGSVDEAAAEFDRAIMRGGDESELRIHKAVALAQGGQPSAALEELGRVGSAAEYSAEACTVRGYVHYIRGDYAAAERDLRLATKLNPRSAYPQTLLADAVHRQDRDDEALRLLDRAVKLDPEDAEARELRGLIRLDRDDLDGAVEDLRQAVALAQTSADAWSTLGEAQRRRGKLDAAAGALDRALELEPENARTLWFRGQVLAEQKKLSKAVTHLKRATELDSSLVEAFATLGEVLMQLSRHDEALAAFDRALTAGDPVDRTMPALRGDQRAAVLANRATVLEHRGHFAKAAAALQEAVRLMPEDADMLARLADSLRLAGRPTDALIAADGALARVRTHADALTVKGLVLAALDRTDEAVLALHAAVSEHPDNVHTLTALGDIYNDTNRLADAEETFRTAIAAQPTSLEAQRGLGDVLRKLGKFDGAYEALETALVLSPADRPTLRLLGYTLLAAGRLDDALSTFRRALEIIPDDPVILYDVVQALLALDDYGEALQVSEYAMRIAPSHGPILAMRGLVLCEVGEFDTAARVLREAVTANPGDATPLGLLGWALTNQQPRHFAEALKALRAAVQIDDDMAYRKELASVLWNLGDPASNEEFTAVLSRIKVASDTKADELAIAGWCFYGLGFHEEAVRAYRLAVRNGAGLDVQFDLALALLSKPDPGAAREAYERSICLAELKPQLRRRGLFRVALGDIEDARRVHRLAGETVEACRAMLESALGLLDAKLAETATGE